MTQTANSVLPVPQLMRESTSSPMQMTERVCMSCNVALTQEDPDYAKQCKECYSDERTKRACRVCNQFKIVVGEPDWKQVCGNCFKDSARRSCIGCHQDKIPAYEPSWRNLCGDCFKNKDLYRKCTKCGEKAIKPGVAPSVNQCGGCWLKMRSKTHTKCPQCHGPRLNTRIGDTMCRDCKVTAGGVRLR